MTRKNQKRNRAAIPRPLHQPRPIPTHVPWIKNPYVLAGGLILTSILAGITQAPTFFRSLNETPSAFQETKESFLTWLKEDASWRGTWSSFPEGVSDMGDMNLTDSDFIFYIESSQGHISGYFTSRAACKIAPLSFGILMFDGNATASSAQIEVFDIVEGRRLRLAILLLDRNKDVITFEQIGGDAPLMLIPQRLGKHPSLESSTSSHGTTEPEQPCVEMTEFFRKLQSGK